MKIKSLTDIITNSSTEVFARVNYETINQIKEIVDLFLKLGNSNKTCDDLFEFKLIPDKVRLYHYANLSEEQNKNLDNMTEEELIKIAVDEETDVLCSPTLEIIPKTKDIPEKLINYLENIGNFSINQMEAVYC